MKILGLLAVSVLLVSAAHAEMPSGDAIRALFKIAFGKTSTEVAAGRVLLTATGATLKPNVQSRILTEEGYIVAANGKQYESDVVIKAIPRGTSTGLGWTSPGNGTRYVADAGEVEFGVVRRLHGEPEDKVLEAIGLKSERQVLDREYGDMQKSIAEYFVDESRDSEKLGAAAREIVVGYGHDESNVVVAYPRIVKTIDGNYAVVSSVRINAQVIDPGAVQAMIREAKGLL